MEAPFFYDDTIQPRAIHIALKEDASRHIVRVLRMKKDDELMLTNGKGNLLTAKIDSADVKKCTVKIIQSIEVPRPVTAITIAISLIKNASRFEWFLEKAAEIGVSQVIPLICERTEKQQYRESRMQGILISAILQSRQVWLPHLNPVTAFKDFIKQPSATQKFIAHCETGLEKNPLARYKPFQSSVILIGPEGDFTLNEISEALHNDFLPVSLGETRLRTETAGIVASALLQNI
ncbi:MAG TPA: RsmE family RNA methyltransferase [Ferruginibacter sp.]|nr:RsmE family RNA methyltransferase [Ferruginibacter sp.]